MSGHPFNGIITSLFIRAQPGLYITSLRSSPTFSDKRPLLKRREGGGRLRVNVCPLISVYCLLLASTPKALSTRLNSLLSESGEHEKHCTLVSRSDTGSFPRGLAMRKWTRERMKGKERERKASIIQHGPDPCIRAPLKIGNP